MNIGSRIAAWFGGKKLPYKRKLAWVSNPDAQWFDTGYKLTMDDVIRTTFIAYDSKESDISGEYVVNCGNPTYGSTNFFQGFSYYAHSPSISATQGTTSGFTIPRRYILGVIGEVYIENGYDYIDLNGTRYEAVRYSSIPQYIAIRFFKLYRQEVFMIGQRLAKVEIFGKHRWVPVMGLDDKVHMFDEITGELIDNQGTGDFLYGELDRGGKCLVRFVKSLVASFSSLSRYLRKEVAR